MGSQAYGKSPIVVVGGGIGGMAFAISAVERGFQVEIVEADPNWRVYGAGISVTGPTYRALRRLNLLDRVKDAGFFIEHGAVICAPNGDVVAEVPMHALEPGLPTNGGIMRPKLHEILSERVRALSIPIHLGVTVTDLVEEGTGVDLELSDGRHLRASLVIAADGAFSATRSRLFPDAPQPEYTGQFCWRIMAKRPAQVDRPLFFMHGDVTAGLMPVSHGEMYMWLLEASSTRRWLADESLADTLRELLAPFSGPMDAVRDAIDAGATIITRPLDAVLVPLPWHRGRTILIGDAAHATTPHLASGAGIAIEDGLILAETLIANEDAEEAFSAFGRRRWDRCRLVVEDSVAIGRMQQTDASTAELNERMRRAIAALAADI